jgi:hypothetical protein
VRRSGVYCLSYKHIDFTPYAGGSDIGNNHLISV